MADNQLKERKRNQRKANLLPDTELRKNIPQNLVIRKFSGDFTQLLQRISQLVCQEFGMNAGTHRMFNLQYRLQ